MITSRTGRARRGADVEHSSVAVSTDQARPFLARLADFLENWSSRTATWVALALVAAVGTAQMSAGADLSLFSLYTAPIALAAWAATPRVAYGVGAVAVTLQTLSSVLAGVPIGRGTIWNAVSDFVLLAIIVMLLTKLKSRLSDEAAFVATDSLTGLLNHGSFIAQLDAELARAERYGRAFTLAYIDLDNFKAVNDL